MPNESSQSAKVRIRNNQRRARARQREYIQDLENKIRAYESEGVQASMEVQQAARAVLQENERLRAETARLKEEVVTLSGGVSQRPQEPVENPGNPRRPTKMNFEPYDAVSQHVERSPFADPEATRGAAQVAEDTTSCEYAAQIIASMRQDVSAEDVSSELGCHGASSMQTCTVNNATLYSTVDRYTG